MWSAVWCYVYISLYKVRAHFDCSEVHQTISQLFSAKKIHTFLFLGIDCRTIQRMLVRKRARQVNLSTAWQPGSKDLLNVKSFWTKVDYFGKSEVKITCYDHSVKCWQYMSKYIFPTILQIRMRKYQKLYMKTLRHFSRPAGRVIGMVSAEVSREGGEKKISIEM